VTLLFAQPIPENVWEFYPIEQVQVQNLSASYHGCAADDHGQIYYAPHAYDNNFNGEFIKYDSSTQLNNSDAYQTYAFDSSPDNVGYSAVVNCSNWIYYVPYAKGTEDAPEYHCNAVRYDSSKPYSSDDSWEWYDCSTTGGYECGGYGGAVASYDKKYIYYVPADQSQCIFLQYDTSKPFNDSSAWLATNCSYVGGYHTVGYLSGAAYDEYVYLAPYSYASASSNASSYSNYYILRYDSSNSSEDSWSAYDIRNIYNLTDESSYGGYVSAIYDDQQYIYYIPAKSETPVLRYDTQQPYDNVDAYEYYYLKSQGENQSRRDLPRPDDYSGATILKKRWLYFIPGYESTQIVRYDLTKPFNSSDSYYYDDVKDQQSDVNEGSYYGACSYGDYSYLAPSYYPAANDTSSESKSYFVRLYAARSANATQAPQTTVAPSTDY
jgi:hypothetical protein